MKYQSPFTEEIEIDTPEEAVHALTHFCDYCTKGAIEQYQCSGYHTGLCEKVKDEIAGDWKKKA